MSLPEILVLAVLGGLEWPIVIGWVIVAALAITIVFMLYLSFGPGTEPYQAESAEPTPTDGEEGSDTPTGSGSH